MKKFFIAGILLLALVQDSTALAATTTKEKLDEFLPRGLIHENSSDVLPAGDLKTEILPQVMKIFLQLVGVVSFAIFVYAGVMLIVSQGNEEEITKFKKVFIWSAIGLAFITTAYALVSGLLKIFEPANFQ